MSPLSILSHFSQSVLNELFGLLLVQKSTVILVVGLPNIVNALLNDGVYV